MQTPIITGILSYGMSGRLFHAPFIEERLGFKLHAVTERSEKKAFLRYPGIKSYNTVDELIADPEIELLIVNTPNYTHYDFAKKALLAGKHVLVEKPFTATSQEARELFSLAEQLNRYILVYQNRRWDSDFQSVKNIAESGKLGKLIEAHFRFDRYKMEIGPKAFKETPVPASGISYDLGPHLLDQVIIIFGKPESFFKIKGKFRPGSQVDDYFSIILKYPEQLSVFVTASMLTANPLPAYVLNGTHGSYHKQRADVQEAQLNMEISPFDEEYGIEDENKAGFLTLIDAHNEKNTLTIEPPGGDYKKLFEAVYGQIRLGKAYPIKKEEIICQIEMLEFE